MTYDVASDVAADVVISWPFLNDDMSHSDVDMWHHMILPHDTN